MRKFVIALFIFTMTFGGFSITAYAVDCAKDTPIDQAEDWLRTIGKKGMEKEQVLAKRKADRMLACAKREASKAAKETRKSVEDMKKKLGL